MVMNNHYLQNGFWLVFFLCSLILFPSKNLVVGWEISPYEEQEGNRRNISPPIRAFLHPFTHFQHLILPFFQPWSSIRKGCEKQGYEKEEDNHCRNFWPINHCEFIPVLKAMFPLGFCGEKKKNNLASSFRSISFEMLNVTMNNYCFKEGYNDFLPVASSQPV